MLDKESLKPVIESLIFAADSAISLDKLVNVLEGEEKETIKAALGELIEEYRAKAGGFLIEEVANGYQFRTNPEFAPWLRKFFKIGLQKISKAAMESLAVLAYKQPVTRGELEAIRGVDSGGVLATLMEKRFIKIVGRKEVPGRPVVYGTTKEFLETFDLKDLSCLPSLKDIQKMEEEHAKESAGESAEDTVQDAVQDSSKAEDRLEDEIQESIQDGTEAHGGEEIQASAEDGYEDGDNWAETEPETEAGRGEVETEDENDRAETGQEREAGGGEEARQVEDGDDRTETGQEREAGRGEEARQVEDGDDRTETGQEREAGGGEEARQVEDGDDRTETGQEREAGGGDKAPETGDHSAEAEGASETFDNAGRTGEAPEDNGERGDSLQEESGGADHPGPRNGKRGDGN